MSDYYTQLSSLKDIKRWGINHTIRPENVQEHSFDVAIIAHLLAVISRQVFGKTLDITQVVFGALYHDASESITGDMPTPVKYFSAELSRYYKKLEHHAAVLLVNELPKALQPFFADYLLENLPPDIRKLIKAADLLSALNKVREELAFGNVSLQNAHDNILQSLLKLDLAEVDYFMAHFMENPDNSRGVGLKAVS